MFVGATQVAVISFVPATPGVSVSPVGAPGIPDAKAVAVVDAKLCPGLHQNAFLAVTSKV